jgi:AraC-like DNA-binding protein
MPIYMDRHDIKGVTAEQVAAIHQLDLKIQYKYGCRALTYWFDEERGTAFCLIEAPEKEAVVRMHGDAHGQVPHRIIEVESEIVERFLGRIEDPEPHPAAGSADTPVFEDPAFRTIMVSCIANEAFIKGNLGMDQSLSLVRSYHEYLEGIAGRFRGRSIKQSDGGQLTLFNSVRQAVHCTVESHRRIGDFNRRSAPIPIRLITGLAAGEPVTGSDNLFGETIRLVNRLCRVVDRSRYHTIVSPAVHDLFVKEQSASLPDTGRMRLLTPLEESDLNRLMDVMESHWNEESLTVSELGRITGMSKSQLYRKVTSLSGRTPSEFIREYRLEEAVRMLDRNTGNIAEIAYAAGFGSPSHFSSSFRRYVGLLPSVYSTSVSSATGKGKG